MDFSRWLFLENGFMPHGHCYLWRPGVLWLHVASDALITLAYLSIPITLVYFIRKRRDLAFHWMFALFAVFIVACGTTHLMEIWLIWHPMYWLAGIVKAVTALASVPTAILLVKLVPQALQLPSPAMLQKANEELQREIAERERAQAELDVTHRRLLDASRQAGMAEVATNVLHNVGNVLNSANVSVNLIVEAMEQSKVSSLARVVTVLREHEQDLHTFMTGDARGKQLPVYLAQLAECLMDERRAFMQELASLRGNIQHINGIVTMQQAYSKVSGVNEVVGAIDLVEDSVRMHLGVMNQHGVELVRNFESAPLLNVDKHKVLQILVNLIGNASRACMESGRAEKRVTVHVASGEGRVKVSVIDNGIGIPAENLTRIFNHGFTTRKDGHGFGLHTGALAARELGGSLHAHSDGAGLGASFTLELPLAAAAHA